MRNRLARFLVASLLILAPAHAWAGKKVEIGRVGEGADPATTVIRGSIHQAEGNAGWKSDVPNLSMEYRTEGKESARISIPLNDPSVAMTPEKGTFQAWVYYDGSTKEHQSDVLVSFLDNSGKKDLFTAYVNWFSPFDDNNVSIEFSGNRYSKDGYPVFGQYARFPYAIKGNQWVHVAFTWGSKPEENRVYLNGVAASSFEVWGKGKVTPTATLPGYLLGAASASIGADASGDWLFRFGLIGDLALSNEVLTSFDLARLKPVIRNLAEDSFKIPGISGKIVAGDVLHVSFESLPGGKATFVPVTGRVVEMTEDPAVPGAYSGNYTFQAGDFEKQTGVRALFVSAIGAVADPVTGPSYSVDCRSRFAISIDRTDLPADSTSSARLKVKVTDANGNAIQGHPFKVTLATTDEYTGLVGSGYTRSRDIQKVVQENLAGATVETRWSGETDRWGEIDFDYNAGFAAKTVILQVKDLLSGDVGADYITSFKEASIDIAMTPPISRAAARRGMLYTMNLTATRTELTADGQSRSVLRATVLDPAGNPATGEPVAFSLSSPNGSLKTVTSTTDGTGTAIAEYVAGKKIGIVVVTATDTVRNVSASISITLLADAPAKILLKARPEAIPADGVSHTDIDVRVTDINDNPNDNTKVEFRLAKAGGTLANASLQTDKFGDAVNRFTAGNVPGIATVIATVRSKIPTEAEMAKARNVLFAPWSAEGEDIQVTRWIRAVGDTIRKGEPVVEYTIGRGGAPRVIAAPFDLRLEFQYVEYWDMVRTGDTLALVTPVDIPNSTGGKDPTLLLSPSRRR